MEQNSPAPRYATLRDYIAVLRRYWWVIGIIALIGAGAGAADAIRKKAVYQSSVEVAFQDPTKDLNIVGIGTSTPETPDQVAALNATTAISPAVMTEVQRDRLENHPLLCARLDRRHRPTSARASRTRAAQKISTANASSPAVCCPPGQRGGNILVGRDNRQTRAQFIQLANNLRRQIARSEAAPGRRGQPPTRVLRG